VRIEERDLFGKGAGRLFQRNDDHGQSSLFGLTNQMSEPQMNRLKETKYAVFYEVIFKRIPEEEFEGMYSEAPSRPNTPVNQLVGAEVLKMMNGWTDEELFDHLYFDVRMKYALGIEENQEVFCPATLYNFRNRVEEYERQTGINPFEAVFDRLTEEQKERFEVESGMQRMDSFQAMSNVRDYTRLQLVVEVLQRLHRVLSEEDQQRYEQLLGSYVGEDSGTYLYRLDPDRYEDELKALGDVYHQLYTDLKERYEGTDEFQVLERVFHEQYEVEAKSESPVTVRESGDLESGSLQSPDDPDATYRKKDDEEFIGHAAHLKETCDPNNTMQLIDDVFVESNNVDDSEALHERMRDKPEAYTEAEQLHVDGAYGSEQADRRMQDLGIEGIQTGIRGRPPDVEFEFESVEEKTNSETSRYTVSCPIQSVTSEPTRTRHKAVFESTICAECPLREQCPTQPQKQGRVLYFDEKRVQRYQRHQRIKELPEEHRTLRNNVEATIKQFTRGMNHKGKLRVRGRFRTELWALCLAMGINLERIHRYLVDQSGSAGRMETLVGLMGDLCGYLPVGGPISIFGNDNRYPMNRFEFVA
jgi:hypothetical protein